MYIYVQVYLMIETGKLNVVRGSSSKTIYTQIQIHKNAFSNM